MTDFGIKESYEEISQMSKPSFKARVKQSCEKKAFEYLCNLKSGQSKGKELSYTKLKMSEYLYNSQLNLTESRLLFKIRSRMINFRSNFKMKYSTAPGVVSTPSLLCPLCQQHEDRQDLLTTCSALVDVEISSSYRYEDMFGQDQDKLVSSFKEYQKKWKRREAFLNK